MIEELTIDLTKEEIVHELIKETVAHDKLKEVIHDLIKMFEKVEVSDSGNEFHPNKITSCRVMDTQKIAGLIKEIKELI